MNSCESEQLRGSPGVPSCNTATDRCVFDSVRQFKLNHSKNLIISHYNVNSIRHKFCEILSLITEFQVDILAIAESKLDDSFPSQQFNICNHKLHRQDRDSRGAPGIMIYINDGIPHRLLKDCTGVHMGVEFMTIELSVKSSKWNLCYIYKPPRITDKVFYPSALWAGGVLSSRSGRAAAKLAEPISL